MKMKLTFVLIGMAALAIAGGWHEDDPRQKIATDLESHVGGTWQVQTHEKWTYVSPATLPEGLEKGTYCIFTPENGQTAVQQAESWMQICQAPFFVLGTNEECVVVTYVSGDHPVSRKIIEALDLKPQRKEP